MSRVSVYRGEALERMALARLRSWDFLVEPIATPVRMVRGKPMRTAKVFADIVGITATGRAVLCECKNRGRRPRPSDFQPHQRATLLEWHHRGGIALVAWIDTELRFSNAVHILGDSDSTQKEQS